MKASSMMKAIKALQKPKEELSVDDAAEILIAADDLKKDKVLMKQVNQLMEKKRAQLEKITSMDQLKAAALKVSKK